MRAVAFLALVALLAGCRTWGTTTGYTWRISGPDRIERAVAKPVLRFTVETRDNDGNSVEGISFYWRVEWVGVFGVLHKGRSFSEEDIRVKGSRGMASIRVYAYDESDALKEVARHNIELY